MRDGHAADTRRGLRAVAEFVHFEHSVKVARLHKETADALRGAEIAVERPGFENDFGEAATAHAFRGAVAEHFDVHASAEHVPNCERRTVVVGVGRLRAGKIIRQPFAEFDERVRGEVIQNERVHFSSHAEIGQRICHAVAEIDVAAQCDAAHVLLRTTGEDSADVRAEALVESRFARDDDAQIAREVRVDEFDARDIRIVQGSADEQHIQTPPPCE